MTSVRRIIVGYFAVCGLVYAVLGAGMLSRVEAVAPAIGAPERYPVVSPVTQDFIDLLPNLPGALLASGVVAAFALALVLRFVKDADHRFVWGSFVGMIYTHLAMTLLTFAAVSLVLLPEVVNTVPGR